MKKHITFLVLGSVSLLVSGQLAFAQGADWKPIQVGSGTSNAGLIQTFRNYSDITIPNIIVPTVVQADFDSRVVNDLFGVFNETTKQFIPFIPTGIAKSAPTISGIQDVSTGQNIVQLYDKNFSTKKDFYLNGSGVSKTVLVVSYNNPIKSNTLTLTLDSNVTLPNTITIKADVNGSNVIVLNKYRSNSKVIPFPETSSKTWTLEIEYSQPLRISEIDFNSTVVEITKTSVRFLALPKNTYKVYSNQEAYVRTFSNQESANLNSNQGVKNIAVSALSVNTAFVPADSDGDKITNSKDNCPNISNPDQEDVDNNSIGDVCDDFDHDGVINSVDNCKDVPNYNQKDTDGDKVGDLCDPDESRLTEKYPALVWAGIGFASLVLIGLLFVAGNKIRNNNLDSGSDFPPQTPPQV
ncbi:MAG: thrombospondin type 3 repeat-containing protein [Nitrospira sp.]